MNMFDTFLNIFQIMYLTLIQYQQNSRSLKDEDNSHYNNFDTTLKPKPLPLTLVKDYPLLPNIY